MAKSIKHTFVSAIADGTTPGMLEPSHWNAEHDLTDIQETLIAGTNITIASDGRTISATGGGGGATPFMPFVKTDGTPYQIPLTVNTELPFKKADGSTYNIPLVTA